VKRPRRPPPGTTIDLIGPSMPVIYLAVLLASVYLLVAGHNHPGGGFVGGLVAGAGVAVRYITGGIDEVRRLARLRPWTILGIGLLIASLTATLPVLFGEEPLDAAKWELDVPLFGHLGISTVLAFDLGVYLVVVGLVLMVFEAFGDDYGSRDRPPMRASERQRTSGHERPAWPGNAGEQH
jgi:multisubunit Na+/H+ antiporter MnhB subunit